MRAAAVFAAALALASCQKTDDAAFGARVHAYLMAHPEVLEEASDRLAAKAQAQALAEEQAGLKRLPAVRASLERDPQDYVANPGGRVTLTEFYDYRCPHCIAIAPWVLGVIHDHPDVRVVFKEMPIFGPTSEHAARAALAVRQAGGDYLGFYRSLMAAPALDDATIDRLARADGARPVALEQPAPGLQDHLAHTAALFRQLGLQGTPAFVIGDEIVSGDNRPALAAALDRARAGSMNRS